MKKVFVIRENPIPFTKEGYQHVLDEQKRMLSDRPDAVENLRKAREMGDLSENGYYRAARQRLTFIDAQLRRLERLRKLGVVVHHQGTDNINIGNTVVVQEGEKKYTYTIVGGYESDPSKMTISHISPIGKALMHKKAGESFDVQTPRGSKRFTVLSIE